MVGEPTAQVHRAVPVAGQEQVAALPGPPLLPVQSLGVTGRPDLRGDHGQDVLTEPGQLPGVEPAGVSHQLGLGLAGHLMG